jgi:hypothetical protein
MTNWKEEFDDIPDEYLEIEIPDLNDAENLEIIDAWFAEDTKNIKNPEIKSKEIEIAQQIVEITEGD